MTSRIMKALPWGLIVIGVVVTIAAFCLGQQATQTDTYDAVVWVTDDTRKPGTECITIPYEGPNGVTYEVKCEVTLEKGVSKKDKACAIATAITKAAENHGPPITASNNNGTVTLTPNDGYKLGNPELTNNSGEKGNKEIKGAVSPSSTQVCAIGFSGYICGYDGFGDESSIMVGWNGESFTGYLEDMKELEPWIISVVGKAEEHGVKANYGYGPDGTLWFFAEIHPVNGSFTMRFGSTDLYLSQKATSWKGKIPPKTVKLGGESASFVNSSDPDTDGSDIWIPLEK